MHYSKHRLTASVTYVTTLTYASTNDQWDRTACPLVSSLKKLNRVSVGYVGSVILPCTHL